MNLQVNYRDGEPIGIVRPESDGSELVEFVVHGSSAVYTGSNADDVTEVVEAVKKLDCVQAVSMEVGQ